MSTSTSQTQSEITPSTSGLVPRPAQIETIGDPILITANTVIVAGDAAQRKAEQLAAWLRPATGFPLALQTPQAPLADPRSEIALVLNAGQTELGAEGYTLEVKPRRIELRAATE